MVLGRVILAIEHSRQYLRVRAPIFRHVLPLHPPQDEIGGERSAADRDRRDDRRVSRDANRPWQFGQAEPGDQPDGEKRGGEEREHRPEIRRRKRRHESGAPPPRQSDAPGAAPRRPPGSDSTPIRETPQSGLERPATGPSADERSLVSLSSSVTTCAIRSRSRRMRCTERPGLPENKRPALSKYPAPTRTMCLVQYSSSDSVSRSTASAKIGASVGPRRRARSRGVAPRRRRRRTRRPDTRQRGRVRGTH